MNEKLLNAALKARENAYCPYSNFKVGAAIMTKDQKIITGVNVENAAYGECICAERNALTTAIAQGYHPGDFLAIAVVADSPTITSPCGACRQVITELMSPEAQVFMVNIRGGMKQIVVGDLLPLSFSKDNLQ